jgi:acyl-CoA thioester hydrolase
MEQEATYRGTVYPWQCDHVGHMNIMWYVVSGMRHPPSPF